jgi:hypothetical protein
MILIADAGDRELITFLKLLVGERGASSSTVTRDSLSDGTSGYATALSR